MKVRQHRGSLADAMKTVVEIDGSMSQLRKVLELSDVMGIGYSEFPIKVEKYGHGIDPRIGWDTHMVYIEGFGPWGFTDGPLTEQERGDE